MKNLKSDLSQVREAFNESLALNINYEAVEEKNGHNFTEAKAVIKMAETALAALDRLIAEEVDDSFPTESDYADSESGEWTPTILQLKNLYHKHHKFKADSLAEDTLEMWVFSWAQKAVTKLRRQARAAASPDKASGEVDKERAMQWAEKHLYFRDKMDCAFAMSQEHVYELIDFIIRENQAND